MSIPWKGACQSNGEPGTYYEYEAECLDRRSDSVRVRLWVWLRLASYSSFFSFAIGHECKVNGVYQNTNIKMDRTFWGGWSTYGWAPYGSSYNDMADGSKWHGPYLVFDAYVPVGAEDTRVEIIPCITRPCICRGGGEPYSFNYLEKCGWQGETGVWRPWDRDEHVGYWAWTELTQDGCFLNNYWLEPLAGGLSIPPYPKIDPATSVKLSPTKLDVLQTTAEATATWQMPSRAVSALASVIRIRDSVSVPMLSYEAHVQGLGWRDAVESPLPAGTEGESLRLEAIRLHLGGSEYSGHIQTSVYVQDSGWQDWVDEGQTAGTTGQGLRLEGVKIRLTDELNEHFNVIYRCHMEGSGWDRLWMWNGGPSGQPGYGKRIEAIQIALVEKDVYWENDDARFEESAQVNTALRSDYSFVPHRAFNEWRSNVGDRYAVAIVPYDSNGTLAKANAYSNTLEIVEHLAPNPVDSVNVVIYTLQPQLLKIDVAEQDIKTVNASWTRPKPAANQPVETQVSHYIISVAKAVDGVIGEYRGEQLAQTETANVNIKDLYGVDEIFDGEQFVIGVQAVDQYGYKSSITPSAVIEYFERKSVAPTQAYIVGARRKTNNEILFRGEEGRITYTGQQNGSYPIARYELVQLESGKSIIWYPEDEDSFRDAEGALWNYVDRQIPSEELPGKTYQWELHAYNTKNRPVYSNNATQTWTQITVYYYGGLIYVYDAENAVWHDGLCYVYDDGEWYEAERVCVRDGDRWKSL